MFGKTVKALQPWAITFAVVFVTGSLKLMVNSYFSIDSPILLFFAAIAVSAWAGGFVQGLAAIILSTVFVWIHFVANAQSADIYIWSARIAMYWIDGLAISFVCSALRSSRNKLKKSEYRLSRVFESNMIGLCVSDYGGNILEANDYYLRLLGADRKMLNEGKLNWHDFTHPGSNDRSQQAIAELKGSGITVPFEKDYVRPDGTQVPAMVAAARIDDKTTISFVLDLSKSKLADRLSQSEQFLNSVVEFIPNMIFVKDAQSLRFVRFNRAGEELLGSSRSSLIGKSDYDFFPKEQADFFVAKDRAVLQNGEVVDIPEEPITTPQGLRYLHTKKIPLFGPDGEAQYLIGISEDITEKKQAEQQRFALLQAQAAQMEAEKSAERLALLSDQAHEANRAKSAFLANISHELRTPLGAMLGFAELALEDQDPQKVAHYVRTVLRNGNELLRIVDEILDLSKAESNSMEIEKIRFSLPNLLSEIHQLLDVRASQKGLKLRFEAKPSIPDFVIADPFRLRQVLLNIVGNAIKFTENGEVSVETSFAKDKLNFIVADTGIGISNDQAARLFRPFMQADDSTTRKFGGTGLGLFLSRKLAQLMGGDVRLLESAPGRGSRFELTVRLSAEIDQEKSVLTERQAIETHPHVDGKTAKVLIVDDSEDNQDLMAAYLAASHIEFDRASRGSEAVILANNSYGAILMDIQMPEMDGFEALRRIRKKGINIPIIAVTAHAMKGDRERCLESGFNEYLSKPISKKSLDQCLRHFL